MTNGYPGMREGHFGNRGMHDDERDTGGDPLEGFDREPPLDDDIDSERPAFLEDDWQLPGDPPRAEWYDDEDYRERDQAA